MPFVSHRGQRIHYTVEGAGPLVVLQHGLLMDGASWKQAGFVDLLADRYSVACVDSLGHGLSDKPADAALYDQEQRAGDIIAVIDDLGRERAHVVGHSMGAWVAVGVARHFPARLASLAIGGWDPVNGVANSRPDGAGRSITYDSVIAFARSQAPATVEWVTPDLEPGLRACWEAVFQLDGAGEALRDVGVPVLLWDGRKDPYHDPMRAFAAANGYRFFSTGGSHLGAVLVHGDESARGLRAFLDQV